MWGLAKQMRAARFAGGALRLDGVRLFYQLDKDGNPVTAAPYVQQVRLQLFGAARVCVCVCVRVCNYGLHGLPP